MTAGIKKIIVFDDRFQPGPYLETGYSYPNGAGLFFVDGFGKRVSGGYVLRITPAGITRMSGVSDKLGLPLDNKGRIVMDDHY